MSATIDPMHRAGAIVGAALVVVAACQPAPTAAPTTTSGSSIPSLMPTPSASTSTAQPTAIALPTKSDTAWGRIWDGVPPSFPLPAGASPAELGPEPASGAFDVPPEAGTPRQIVDFYVVERGNGWHAAMTDGPLEDGSYTVEGGVGYSFCRFQVRIVPLGSLTRLTILYGDRCEYF